MTRDRYPCTAMEAFFRSPPLLSIEDTPEYNAMRAMLLNRVKPQDEFEMFWIDDILHHSWQIRRYRKSAADIIGMTQKAALRTLLESVQAVDDQDEIDDHIENWFKGGQFKDAVLKFLDKYGIEERHITAQAMELRLSQLGQIERMIGDFERRRSGALRELEFYRIAASWRAPKGLPALIDAAADEIKTAADDSKAAVDESKTAADDSKAAVDESKTAADESKTTADESETAVDESKTTADESKTAVATEVAA
jgi:hypothetical protein